MKTNLLGLSKQKLSTLFSQHVKPIETFRVNQMYKWMYQHGASTFNQMTNLSTVLRNELDEKYSVQHGNLVHSEISKIDRTRKFLIEFEDKKKIESVFIEHAERGTMCVSSQVGCSLNCKFCKTGTQPIERNLTSSEILSQILIAQKELDDFRSGDKKPKISNIVFMGQGEPLYNYRNVHDAVQILIDPNAFGFSKRKVIISTSGVVPVMKKVVRELGVNLAISLHATTNEMRDHLVPLNKIFPIELILDTVRELEPEMRRQVTFEYVMLNDVNDSLDDAKRLVKLLKGISCNVNLIAFNEWQGSGFTCSPRKQIIDFSNYLQDHYINAPVRFSHGNDINAACGQLKSTMAEKRSFTNKSAQQVLY